jgi:hypothetical protein
MKWIIPLVLLCGSLVSMCAQADEPKGTHPRWVIILTITDTTTGELLEQRELGPELEYGDPAECESMTARLGPLPTTGKLAAALTCRKVNRQNAVLL